MVASTQQYITTLIHQLKRMEGEKGEAGTKFLKDIFAARKTAGYENDEHIKERYGTIAEGYGKLMLLAKKWDGSRADLSPELLSYRELLRHEQSPDIIWREYAFDQEMHVVAKIIYNAMKEVKCPDDAGFTATEVWNALQDSLADYLQEEKLEKAMCRIP